MASSIVENIYIVNAPAGSGKTTKIKSMVISHIIENPIDNVLCITYTNRATEELLRDLNSKNIHVSTIHSFLNKYLSIYFGHQEIIDLYFELYGTAIQERIDNSEQKDTIEASNKKYSDKYGVLDMDTIKKNISRLYYNETAFNSLYYGGLSHDDLIWFSEIVFTRFQKVRERLTLKYQAIFVDEYQDSSDSVLKLFYDSVKDTSTKLYFLGDKMQQIYTNYRGGFEEELQILNKTISLSTNHRSLPVIIDLLNNMYNDPEYVQNPSDDYIGVEAEHEPRVIICNNIGQEVDDELSLYPQALCLYLLNQQKFDSIGASNLYRNVNRLDRYSFNKKLSATDVLSDSSSENPDQLLSLLFLIGNIYGYYSDSNLGNVLKILKENTRVFNSDFASITKHQDKIRMKESLDRVLQVFGTTSAEIKIKDLVAILIDESVINSIYGDDEFITEYEDVLSVSIIEFHALRQYIDNPNISTQHGVKGESHDTVFFIANDSNRTPVVHMYKFLELWSMNDVSLTTFEQFYYEYKSWIKETDCSLGFSLKDLTVELFNENEGYITQRVSDLVSHFEGNIYFDFLCKTIHLEYLKKPNKTRACNCLKDSMVYGSLSAYKLFYVGCSRARKNLTIFIDERKVLNFEADLCSKLITTGFKVDKR